MVELDFFRAFGLLLDTRRGRRIGTQGTPKFKTEA